MSVETYNTLTSLLLYGSLCALAISVVYLVSAIVGWRGPNRSARLIRFVGFLAMFPVLVGMQQYLLYGIYLPQLRQAGDREMLERKSKIFAESTNVSVGEMAPAFDLVDADGNLFTVGGNGGKVVLVHFFATWCGPCQLELPKIQKLWERYRDNQKFSLLVIGREESLEAVNEFRAQNHYTFPIAPDPDRKVFSLFAKEIIPRIFLISSDGKIVYATLGYSEPELDQLEKMLSELLR